MQEDNDKAQRTIESAIDVLALGFPFDGTETEKVSFMAELREAFEGREAAVRELFRGAGLG